jgi:hypothetical protein
MEARSMIVAIGKFAYRFSRAGTVALLLVVIACTQSPSSVAAVAVPPLAPGYARIWIYRDYEPYETLARPYVRFDNTITGISDPGGAFYRDVAPGTYTITVDSYGTDVYQFATVALAPGQEVYVKVESLRSWASDGGGRSGGAYARDTFYTRVIPPTLALAELPSHPLDSGR